MADLPVESNQSEHPESNNFDNDFEKLDPFSPQESTGTGSAEQQVDDDFGVSSTTQPELPEEDLYSPSPELVPTPSPTAPPEDLGLSEAEPLVKLADVSDEPPAVIPQASQPMPVTPEPDSAVAEPVETKPETPVEPPAVKTEKTSFSPDAWLKKVDPRVIDLIYWRDVKKTGIVFGSTMVLLLSLALFSVLSVVAYLSLAALTVTLSFRIYKNVLGAVQKTGEGHPFKEYLEVDVSLPEEKVHEMADVVMKHASCCLKELRRLFLIEDIIDSLKFGLLLWVLTYVGAWFNGMTLIILAVVDIFTLPKVYETYKVQIDQYVDIVKTQVKNVVKQVQDKIPIGKKKQQ